MNQDTNAAQQAESGPAQAPGTPAAPATPAMATAPAKRAPDWDRRGRRGWVVAGLVIVVAAAAVGAALATGAFRGSGHQAAGAGSGYRTGTATVTRQSLTSQTEENATLGDAGTWSVAVPASSSASSASSSSSSAGSGTFTWLPQIGQVIRQGHQIYGMSGSPVVVLYGPVPSYRDLSEGMTGPESPS